MVHKPKRHRRQSRSSIGRRRPSGHRLSSKTRNKTRNKTRKRSTSKHKGSYSSRPTSVDRSSFLTAPSTSDMVGAITREIGVRAAVGVVGAVASKTYKAMTQPELLPGTQAVNTSIPTLPISPTSPTSPKRFVVVDLGTPCDFRLMNSALEDIAKRGHELIFIGKKNRKPMPTYPISSASYDESLQFDQPAHMTSDIELIAGDPDKQLYQIVGLGTARVTEYRKYYTSVRQRFIDLAEKFTPDGFLIHWGFLPMIADLNIWERYKLIVMCFAPAAPSSHIPWLLSSSMKDKNYTLYDNHPNTQTYNQNTHLNMIRRGSSSLAFNNNATSLLSLLNRFTYVSCWDKYTIDESYYSTQQLAKIYIAGTVLDVKVTADKVWASPDNREMVPQLETFIERRAGTRLVMVSLGSYGSNTHGQKALGVLRNIFREHAATYSIIWHNPPASFDENREDHEFMVTGWIQYEWVVPRCYTVVFTGSVCLQAICLYNTIPMFFVPLLGEQFFWARNYKHMTGKPFYSYRESEKENDDVLRAVFSTKEGDNDNMWDDRRELPYLQKQAQNIRATNAAENIARIVEYVTE